MDSKEFLSQGDKVYEAKKSLTRQIEYCNSEIGNLRSVDYSKEYVTGTRDNSNSKDGKLILIREDCKFKLNELTLKDIEYQQQVQDCLSKMPEGNVMRALLHYHVLGESQREIGRRWGYSHTQIQRFLEQGYKEFPMPEHPIEFGL